MKKWLLLLVALPIISLADNLTISNETDDTVYAAVYYVPTFGNKVDKASQTLVLSRGANLKLVRPAQKFGTDRELLILPSDDFPPTYTKGAFKNAGARLNVGQLSGKRFYIGKENGLLRGYTVGQWEQRDKSGFLSSVQATVSTLAATTKAQFSRAYKAVVPEEMQEKIKQKALSGLSQYWDSAYENKVAQVRIGNGVSQQERAVIGKRMLKARKAMEAKVGPIVRAPKIAMVASGGGWRAMLFTLGAITAAQKSGLWDMTIWITGLSGGTWGINSYYENNAKKGRVSAEQFRAEYISRIKNKRLEYPISTADLKLIGNLFQTDIVAGKPFTFVNLYGALLANRIFENFGNERQTLRLSDQAELINTGDFPVPICTAVSGEEGQPEYYWYGFTPFEVSMEPWKQGGIGISVPTWGYGRKYRNGSSTGYMPEMSLGFQLGTFGSAFAADVDRVWGDLKDKMPATVRPIIQEVLVSRVGGKRLTWAAVPNFGRGLAESPLRSADGLQLVDGAMDFNLPYPPVSGMRAERSPDIVILVNASPNLTTVKQISDWAKKKGLKFPAIDFNKPVTQGVTIYEDKNDPSVPIIILVAEIADANQAQLVNKPQLAQYKKLMATFDPQVCHKEGPCGTFNFNYSAEDALKLSTQAEFNIMAYIDDIFDVIKRRAAIA